jgi:hypothetical protein
MKGDEAEGRQRITLSPSFFPLLARAAAGAGTVKVLRQTGEKR